MARLPFPGKDEGIWGRILNAFLLVAHNPDGSLRDSGLIATKAADTSVVHRTGDETVEGVKTFTITPHIPAPAQATHAASKAYVDSTIASGITADATPSTKGKVRLAGDLAGTADSPRVVARSVVKTVGPAGSAADYVCDGVADDVQINQAIVAVNATGGGTVVIRAGTYDISALVTPRIGVTIRGEGTGATKLVNSSNTDAVFKHINDVAGLTHFTLEHLTIICKENGGGAWYSRGNLTYATFRHLRVVSPGSGRNGFLMFFDQFTPNHHILVDNCYFEGLSNGWDMLGSGMSHSTVQHCTFINGDGQGTANTNAKYCKYLNNHFENVGNAISLEGTAEHNLIEGNYCLYTGYIKSSLIGNEPDTSLATVITNNRMDYCKNGITVGQGTGCIITHNVIYRCGGDGIYANCHDSLIAGNILYQNNSGNSFRVFGAINSNKGGIHMVSSAFLSSHARNRIIDNTLFGNNNSWTHPVTSTATSDKHGGIGLGSSYGDTIVSGNSITIPFGAGTAEIADSGARTLIKNNFGVNPERHFTLGSISGSATVNRANGAYQDMTLTANCTLTITNGRIRGDTLTLKITQDATGGRSLLWPSTVKFSNGAFAPSPAAASVDIISFIWDGSNWREMHRSLNQ